MGNEQAQRQFPSEFTQENGIIDDTPPLAIPLPLFFPVRYTEQPTLPAVRLSVEKPTRDSHGSKNLLPTIMVTSRMEPSDPLFTSYPPFIRSSLATHPDVAFDKHR
jgi:hypothetical protein